MAEKATFDFTYHPSLADFTVSNQAYLATHSHGSFDAIGTAVVVLASSNASAPRVFLLQRAAHDSYPGKWEPPGGACDDEDESILHSAARELWEESGLEAARFDGIVGDAHFFASTSGRKVCRFSFAVHVKSGGDALPAAKIDPNEHQNCVWATEDEVKARKAEGVDLDFTTKQVESTVLLAFDLARERQYEMT